MMHVLLTTLREHPAPAVPNLIVGIVLLVVGVIVIRRRKSTRDATVRQERRWFGKGFGEFADRTQRPVWIAVAGVFGLIMGAAMVTYAFVRLLTVATG